MNRVRKWICGCILSAICATVGLANGAEDKVSKFLGEDGELKETLELKDAQEGFVGVTGTVWIIEPDGGWLVADFINEKIYEPKQQGCLSSDQVVALVALLESVRFVELPPFLGRDLKVNRHMITISFGQEKSTLVLNTGEPISAPPPGNPQAAKWDRFLRIVKTIRALLNAD